jgi:hypothetical protein
MLSTKRSRLTRPAGTVELATFHSLQSTATPSKYLLALVLCMSAFPKVAASAPLHELNTSVNLDPISLITLFFDSAEKDLIDRTGDMTLLACFGLFVNPSTTWYQYTPPHTASGLRYYNPRAHITSMVEVQQVNSYLVSIASELNDCGAVVWVKPLHHKHWWPRAFSLEWMIIRPFALAVLVCIAGLSRDLVAVGAICTLLFGQAIAIVKTVYDGKVRDQGSSLEEQTNIIFMPNNVTMVVKCHGLVFVKAMSSARTHHPGLLRTLTTLIFMGGILLVGLTGINFKIAFLVMHAFQAALLGVAGWQSSKGHVINGALWEIDTTTTMSLKRRREAYVWASKLAGTGTQWLKDWQLAAGETLAWVEGELATERGGHGNPGAEDGLKVHLPKDRQEFSDRGGNRVILQSVVVSGYPEISRHRRNDSSRAAG